MHLTFCSSNLNGLHLLLIKFRGIGSEGCLALDHGQGTGGLRGALTLLSSVFLLVIGLSSLHCISGCSGLLGTGRNWLNSRGLRKNWLRNLACREHVLLEEVCMRLPGRDWFLLV